MHSVKNVLTSHTKWSGIEVPFVVSPIDTVVGNSAASDNVREERIRVEPASLVIKAQTAQHSKFSYTDSRILETNCAVFIPHILRRFSCCDIGA